MKKIINNFMILAVFPFFLSCATTESSASESVIYEAEKSSIVISQQLPVQSVSSEINEAVNRTSQILIERLPANSAVALFNLSLTDTELTDLVIKEISFKLKSMSSLKIVGSNDGVQFAVSCSISGKDFLRRLRIKTWDVRTGETVASIVYPVDETGKRFIQNLSNCGVSPEIEIFEMRTITENGVTVDFHTQKSGEFDSIRQTLTHYGIYIDEIGYFEFIFSDYENQYLKQRSFSCQMLNVLSSDSQRVDNWSSREVFDYYDFEASYMKFLGDQGVSSRNMSSIAKIFAQVLN